MKIIHTYLPFLLVAALVISSCSKSKPLQPDLEPEKAILGKWEVIEAGGHPYNGSGEFVEYLPDSISRVYDYTEDRFTSQTPYWLTDSILYRGIYVDGVFQGNQYKYHFFDNNNKLRLEFHEVLPIISVWVYKRIK